MKRLDQESQTTPENIFNNSENASNEKRSISVGAAMGIAIGGVVLCGLGFVAGMQVGDSSVSQMSRQAGGGPPGMNQSQGGPGGSRQQAGGNSSTSQAQSGQSWQSDSSSTGQTPSAQNNTTNTPPSDASQSGVAPQPTSQSSRQ